MSKKRVFTWWWRVYFPQSFIKFWGFNLQTLRPWLRHCIKQVLLNLGHAWANVLLGCISPKDYSLINADSVAMWHIMSIFNIKISHTMFQVHSAQRPVSLVTTVNTCTMYINSSSIGLSLNCSDVVTKYEQKWSIVFHCRPKLYEALYATRKKLLWYIY